jgi:nucleoside phosphorylase
MTTTKERKKITFQTNELCSRKADIVHSYVDMDVLTRFCFTLCIQKINPRII